MKETKDDFGSGNKDDVKTYQDIYNEIWSYCWKHMIDHKYGAWFRIRYQIQIC